jgi:hypothetical protein
MSKKLNSMPDYQARLPKHPHDVSQSTAFTAAPGMILPVYYDMLHLGDELHFSASEFVRLNPLEQQALGDIDVHLDFFFVPLTVMYLPTSSMFYQTDDLVSSLFSRQSTSRYVNFPTYNFVQSFNNLIPDPDNYEARLNEPCGFCSYSQVTGLTDWLDNQFFDCIGKSIYRLMDMLDMSPDALVDRADGRDISYYPSYTPWFALAYQAIYQLFYRNDDREPRNYHYNIDDKFSTGTWSEFSDINLKSILYVNYVNRPKDYYNAVKVSPISSSVSLLSSGSLSTLYGQVNEWINNNSMQTVQQDRQNVTLGKDSTQIKPASQSISSATVRQMFMAEKFLRVVGRADKDYESQFLAHYGIKIPHDVMHNITHLGHDMITIRPEAVISQANTWNPETATGSALGEIGGKGSGMLSGRKRNFTAPFHGVFMITTYIVPRKRYVVGLSKLHQLVNPSKFWQPEYDLKGMQPLFAFECQLNSILNNSMSKRLGWQFAYEEFKRKSDRVTRAFTPTLESSRSVNTYSPWVISGYPFGFNAPDGSQVVDYESDIAPWRMLVSPTDLNVNMQVPYNPSWPTNILYSPWVLYQTDPFICDFNLYCKKVNRMSEYGEPEL